MVKAHWRKSKLGTRFYIGSYSRKARPKRFKKIKVYPKVYKFKTKRDEYGRFRGLKEA